MSMKDDTLNKYGWTEEVDSHLIRNSEWGAVAYLCYSAFGSVPQINGNGQYETRWYDFHTGAGPVGTDSEEVYGNNTYNVDIHGYNTALGQLASTTGNVYGIYDMSGGAWERVAAYYDNGNAKLSANGNSENAEYFDINTNKLKSEYEKYWEAYEVGSKEKSNSIEIIEGETLTQEELWDVNKKEDKYEQKRYELTKETWNNLEKIKGIGANEVAGSWSYRGLVEDSIKWKVSTTDTSETYGRSWNSDYVSIGSADKVFVYRGGSAPSGAIVGIMRFHGEDGRKTDHGFRPVLSF